MHYLYKMKLTNLYGVQVPPEAALLRVRAAAGPVHAPERIGRARHRRRDSDELVARDAPVLALVLLSSEDVRVRRALATITISPCLPRSCLCYAMPLRKPWSGRRMRRSFFIHRTN